MSTNPVKLADDSPAANSLPIQIVEVGALKIIHACDTSVLKQFSELFDHKIRPKSYT